MIIDWGADEIVLTDSVSVLTGGDKGKYPSGNSMVVTGASESLIIDPSVTVVERGGAPVEIDLVLNSHLHEDHVPGNGLFLDARVQAHTGDLAGIHSIEALLDVYGLEGEARATFGEEIIRDFSYVPRPDATEFCDGDVFDLGGGVTVEAVHLPGHTAGHSGFRTSTGVFFMSDIDLTGFGPYYGDVFSSLDQFEESLEKVRLEDASHYVTYHQKGIIEGRETMLEMLDKFHSVIGRRHDNMLEFLAEPRSVADMVKHRFVYRSHVENTFLDAVERRTATLHLARMLDRDEATEIEPGRYQRS